LALICTGITIILFGVVLVAGLVYGNIPTSYQITFFTFHATYPIISPAIYLLIISGWLVINFIIAFFLLQRETRVLFVA
jgi:hypothetical protein